MTGVIPLLIFFNDASINTFLDLALDFFNLFLWSGIETTPHVQFQVHLDQFFTREGGRQGAEYLLIAYEQFLQSGVKVKTLKFLQEILLSMEVALSMFFLFLPMSSFGRHVMASNSSSAAARKSQVAVAIALQSVNNKEASNANCE